METPGRHDDVLTDYWRSVVDYVNGAPPPPPPQPKRYGAGGDSALSVPAPGKQKLMPELLHRLWKVGPLQVEVAPTALPRTILWVMSLRVVMLRVAMSRLHNLQCQTWRG